MSFLLIALLAASMAVVVSGLCLSSKPQIRGSRAAYNVGRGGRRLDRSGSAAVRTRRMVEAGRMATSTRQLTVEIGSRAGASVSLSMVAERWFGGRVREPKPLAVILVGLISLFVLGLYALSMWLPHAAVIGSMFFYGQVPPASAQNLPKNNFPYNVSQKLIRI